MDDRSVLMKLVRLAMRTLTLAKMMHNFGYSDNPYYDIHGEIADTIYEMLGEHTNEYGKSITNLVLSSDIITDDQRVDILSHHYRKNHAIV